MTIGFVIPAFHRYAITNLALTGIGWLTDMLAGRGVTSRILLIANDGNLEIAEDHGVETLEMENKLGARVNAGIAHMAECGADWFCFTGADNWLHPDLFVGLGVERVRAGLTLAIVDMERPRLRKIRATGGNGAAPWLIPRSALEACDFKPCPDEATRGIEQEIRSRIAWPFIYDEPNHLARVDFKTQANITPYQALACDLEIEESPWLALTSAYPELLVAFAQDTAQELTEGLVAA